jgi:hypothetical protein
MLKNAGGANPTGHAASGGCFGDRKMFLTYVGESGITGTTTNDASQPHQVYTGLFVHESQSISVNGEFNALCRRHFGAPLGEEGAPSVIRPVDLYQGLGYFSSWQGEKRNELIQDCLGIMIRRETPVITSYINKEEFNNAKAVGDDPYLAPWNTPTGPLVNKFFFAIGMFLDELNMSSMSEDQIMDGSMSISNHSLIVAQNGASMESKFMSEFLRSDEGIDATGMIDDICFVEQEHSVGSQLANLVAYFVRRWLQNPERSHPYFDGLRDNKVIQVIYPVTI